MTAQEQSDEAETEVVAIVEDESVPGWARDAHDDPEWLPMRS